MESSMNSIGILRDVYHEGFPLDPEENYIALQKKVLDKLGIEIESWFIKESPGVSFGMAFRNSIHAKYSTQKIDRI